MAAFAGRIAPGYELDASPDLSNPAVRARLSPTAIKGFQKIMEKWGIKVEDARQLCGGVSSGFYYELRNEPKTLSQDILVRISLLVGIFKALNILYSETLADVWIKLPNRNQVFGGMSPLEYMIRRGQPGMVDVRRLLDARRGGQWAYRLATFQNLPHQEEIFQKDLHQEETHRLIPSKYSEPLTRLATDRAGLDELMELDNATYDRLLGELGLLPGVSVQELVYGVRYAHIVNASFTHAGPYGARFNDSARGAWYAGFERETAIAEVVFHKVQQLTEIDWDRKEASPFDDYLADFITPMHSLLGANTAYQKYLEPSPVPACYAESQQLAATLLAQKSNGIIYPSVRRKGGTCLVCFRPALVYNVRRSAQLELVLKPPYSETNFEVRDSGAGR